MASRSKWHRIEALLRNRAFIEDYIRARDAWREGNRVAFPPGTYLLIAAWVVTTIRGEEHQ